MTAPLSHRPDEGSSLAVPSPEAIAAERELTARFWERIRVFACRRLADPAAAEDVAQEAVRLVGAALRAGRVADLSALPGYVFRTAQHLCLQRHRSATREARALDRLTLESLPERPREDPLSALIGAERRTAVRQALTGLSRTDRDLLELLYYQDVDVGAAALRLGITAEALRVRKHRALRRLSVLLGEREEDVTP
jgi:RNA polymerase sigma-70 factor (ECF subfamily)